MPNGNYLRLDMAMFIVPDAAPSDTKETVKSERQKIDAKLPVLASVTKIYNQDGHTKVDYTVSGDNDLWDDGAFFEKRDEVTGEDIKNLIQQERLRIDSALNEGEIYARQSNRLTRTKEKLCNLAPYGTIRKQRR